MPSKKYVMEDIQDHFRIELEEAVFVLKKALEVNIMPAKKQLDIVFRHDFPYDYSDYDELEESCGILMDAYKENIEAIRKSSYLVGPWLSAALEDEKVCDEMKSNIREWFKLNAEILKKLPEDL